MAKAAALNLDLKVLSTKAGAQFRGLNTKEPGQWPPLPKVAAWLGATVAVVVAGWFGLLAGVDEELIAAREQEPKLKETYRNRVALAVNLNELRKQKLQVEEYVAQLEKQLPGKAEMDALLSDINQSGLGRGLQFELFRPGQVQVRDYYAELPIAIRVTGRYHDVGAFAADVANLSRIVTLQNLNITPVGAREGLTGMLSMEATAHTYRYLDSNEVAAQRQAAAKPGAPK